ncbi:MAG: histidine kinase [Chitinophagaceae bacterium]
MDTIQGLRNFREDHMQQHPFIFSDRPIYRFLRHGTFWFFWWIFQGFLYSFLQINSASAYWQSLQVSLLESFVFMLNHLFLAYALMYFVIPFYLLQQKYWSTALWTFVLFIATALFSVFLGRYIINPLRFQLAAAGYVHNYFQKEPMIVSRSLLAGLRGGITIGGIAAAIKLMKYWYVKEQRNLQLQKENMASQLQLLKAQVHPHFLFNTLNNIYSHTQNAAPVAAQLITGLSDILRFILYEGSQPLVPLSKELKLLKDYISLESVRYGNRLDLYIDLPGQTNEVYIAPLLMLPLIENCFKHGASTMLEQPWISLQITLQDKYLHLKLLNGKANETAIDSSPSGIGIQNVEKRLQLIYPGKYDLSITNEEDIFIVNLKIELERGAKAGFRLTNLLAEPTYV